MKTIQAKNAFTLVEVMVSIVLLGLIFTFLYSTINSVKKQNNHYIAKSDTIKHEERIFVLFNLDITQIIGNISVTSGIRYDIIQFQTRNSIYGIIEPQLIYLVSKKDNALVRIESLKGFDLYNKDQLTREFIYGDILTTDCISFKVSHKDGIVSLLFRAKNLKPMVLKIPTVS
ncbi:prepilin-type N-terminal cleavage/methylation domain-containing protein [Sulfurimonas sp. SAG-AH-194-I05]|nr:prepilin-type N-terminal cleavage/methylation domain-containing protein [Sulfurimonas sp. SAG-AH-194-I05]MDF1875398.1 prepilin-type N-terminal cleavage/methylation domain-containing protein [Sulfurimonas sp. SAG-AH-194-I05]